MRKEEELYPQGPELLERGTSTKKRRFFGRILDRVKGYRDSLINNLRDFGKKYGVVPYFNGLKKYVKDFIKEPTYEGFPELARKAYLSNAEKVIRYYAKKQGMIPYIGRNIKKIVVGKLPTQWGLKIEKVTDHYYKIKPVIIGKIYGAFDQIKKILYLDTVNFKKIKDPEKSYLKESGLPINKEGPTTVHELTHTVQDTAGTLNKYPLELIEGEASMVTDKITPGEKVAYPRAVKAYKRKYGESSITRLRPAA